MKINSQRELAEKYGDYIRKITTKNFMNSYEKKCLGKIESDAKFFMQFEGLDMNPQEYFLMKCFDKGYEC